MSEEKITIYSEDEHEQRRIQGVDTGTDWERVNALSDEDIEKATAEDPDAAPFLGKEFWDNASFVPFVKKVDIHLQLDRTSWNFSSKKDLTIRATLTPSCERMWMHAKNTEFHKFQ